MTIDFFQLLVPHNKMARFAIGHDSVLNPSFLKLATKSRVIDPLAPLRPKVEKHEIKLAHRARNSESRAPSRKCYTRNTQGTGRGGIPHLLGRRQVAARPHAHRRPHAQGPRHGSPGDLSTAAEYRSGRGRRRGGGRNRGGELASSGDEMGGFASS